MKHLRFRIHLRSSTLFLILLACTCLLLFFFFLIFLFIFFSFRLLFLFAVFLCSLSENYSSHRVFTQSGRSDASRRDLIETIGRLGEKFVYEYLLHALQSEIERGTCRLHWLNDEEEQGKPYDLLLTVS